MPNSTLPRLTREQIKEFHLTPGEIELMESQPGVAYENFVSDWVDGAIPLERLRTLDLNALKTVKVFRQLVASGREPEFIGINIRFFCIVGDKEWNLII